MHHGVWRECLGMHSMLASQEHAVVAHDISLRAAVQVLALYMMPQPALKPQKFTQDCPKGSLSMLLPQRHWW